MGINVHLKGLIKMSAFTNAINDINRKKAGMFVLCMSASAMLEGEAKANASWTDRTSHARQSLMLKLLEEEIISLLDYRMVQNMEEYLKKVQNHMLLLQNQLKLYTGEVLHIL